MKKCRFEDRHIEDWKKFENCMFCNKKIWKSFEEKLDDEYKGITQKMKDDFMWALWDYKNIWEAIKIAKIPDTEHRILLTWKIIEENTETLKYIRIGKKIIT